MAINQQAESADGPFATQDVGSSVGFNKVCALEDFTDPELIETMRDVFRHEIRNFTPAFPQGAEYRKYWEIAMSVRALRHFGALRPDASILGVGAGTEATLFYLTNHVGRVFATDLYLSPGTWGSFAPGFMLVEPERVAPYAFRRERLVVQHMDGRALRYDDNSFDGIFSSGSIEHFGSMQFIANAAYEMGRVLKPGGILTLSTEFRVSGPPGGDGWEGLRFFSAADLQRYIIEASGLELVDPLDTHLSAQTLETKRDFTTYLNDQLATVTKQGRYPRVGEIVWSTYPHLVLYHEGYVFCSVHLTLRKPEVGYPVVPNEWAKPSAATLAAVDALSQEMGLSHSNVAAAAASEAVAVAPFASQHAHSGAGVPAPNVASQAVIRSRIGEFTGVLHSLQHRLAERLPEPFSFSYRTLRRIRKLGLVLDAQSRIYPALADYQAEMDSRLTATDADLANRVAAANAALPERLQEIITTQSTLIGQDANQLRQLSEQNVALMRRVDQLAEQVQRSAEQNVSLARRLDELTQGQAALVKQVRLNTSQARRQRFHDRLSQATPDKFRLTGHDIAALIQEAEHHLPVLHEGEAVELSIQDVQAEEALLGGVRYLGGRHAAQGEAYRAPDVWYHLDFTADWARGELFANAAAKVVPGGCFVLMTDPAHAETPTAAGLRPVADRTTTSASGVQVRVLIWQIDASKA